MLFWTLRITIISIILIFLIHHLIVFFKTTLTVPKIKDMVNAPAQKYENMFNTMTPNHSYYVPNIKPDVNTMKNELKSFLKKQLKGEKEKEKESSTNIDTLDTFSANNYTYV